MADLAVREGGLAEAVLLAVLPLADVLVALCGGVGALPVLLVVLPLAGVRDAVRQGQGAGAAPARALPRAARDRRRRLPRHLHLRDARQDRRVRLLDARGLVPTRRMVRASEATLPDAPRSQA